MSTTNAIHVKAAHILRKRHDYRSRPFAEIVLAVAATAILKTNAITPRALARDTYRSERGVGDERTEAKRRARTTSLVAHDGTSIDLADDCDHVAEFDDMENTQFIAGKIKAMLGPDLADGIACGFSYRELSDLLGTNPAAISRHVASVRATLCGEFE